MKTLALTLAAVACACVLGLRQLERPRTASASATRVDLRDEIAGVRADAWRWQRVMGVLRTPARPVARVASASYQRWVLRLWQRRALAWRARAQHPPHLRAWLCIHRYEGPWRAHTGNGFFGGLQMDVQFQQLYARGLLRTKGTADHWTPLEQIWAAERALASGRGFAPWPNTARACGLL
jgi:hypothetical protein